MDFSPCAQIETIGWRDEAITWMVYSPDLGASGLSTHGLGLGTPGLGTPGARAGSPRLGCNFLIKFSSAVAF